MIKKTTKYVDGYVLVVPKKNLALYTEIATKAGKIWRKYGALEYKECAAEDMVAKKLLPFPKLLKLKPSETAIFSYIVFKSRAHRDEVNAKVMKDPFMNSTEFTEKDMPFDVKRMSYGGFNVIVDA